MSGIELDNLGTLIAEGCVQIEPIECNSIISYRFVDGRYNTTSDIYGNISLTDCSRMISWNIPCDETGELKLKKIIKIFNEVLVAFKTARELQDKKNLILAKNKKKKKK
jgi:hypothetical protein